jgi:hypothetical protein
MTGFLLTTGLIMAQAPGTPSLDELSASLRTLLVDSLPPVLHESSSNWGRTTQVPHAVHWKGQGLKVRPKVIKTARNDGTWRKLKITTQELGTLVFRLSDLKSPSADQMTVQAYLSFQCGVEFEQQIWESGVRLYSDSTRARLRVHLPMQLEITIRMEQGKGFLPDTVFRVRVLKADMHYDQLVVEHIAGVGGTAAKLIGEALHSMVKQAKPSLERDLLQKANAAIVKAGDTREIRLSLSSLFELKKR